MVSSFKPTADDFPIFIPVKYVKFIPFSQKHWLPTPPPMSRIFSLMRMVNCETVGLEVKQWSDDCSEQQCGMTYYSCQAYVSSLQAYGCRFLEKKCYKLSFFSCSVDRHSVYKVSERNFLG